MKKKKSTRIIVHLVVWLILSVIYFFLSDALVTWLFPGFSNALLWVWTVLTGLTLIFIVVLISLIISLCRKS